MLLLVSCGELITWIGSVVGRSVIRLKRTVCDRVLLIDLSEKQILLFVLILEA